MEARRKNSKAARALAESDRVQKAATMSAKNRRHRRRMKLFGGAAAIVVFITTYMLILPAITLEHTPICGFEKHTHTAECYANTQELTCGQEESAGHTHTEACYQTEQLLVCGQAEGEDHTHSGACYETVQTLVCGQEEYTGHTHTDACYTEKSVLLCSIPEHTHVDACYPVSEPEEAPAETDVPEEEEEINPDEVAGYGDSSADLESQADWEATLKNVELTGNWAKDVLAIADSQLGYHESTLNYVEFADGTRKGYSRYGDWYGSAYGDWCAMFCSFCIHYAQVPDDVIPLHSGCPAWIYKLQEWGLYRSASSGYVPKAGDLIFYDWESNNDCDHVGLVYELQTQNDGSIFLKTIEGNISDSVQYSGYALSDYRILGFGELPENPDYVDPDAADSVEIIQDKLETSWRTIESEPAEDGAIAVIEGNLPENAIAVIEPAQLEEAQLENYLGEAAANAVKSYVAYDIRIMVGDLEYQPDETVKVYVKEADIKVKKDQMVGIAHISDDTDEAAKVRADVDDDGNITFEADGFSIYIIYTFTVDFHFGDLTFSINGMDSILLSELFEKLGIDRDVADVTGVEFSDETLIQIEQLEGDWKLTSLQAFSTEETLTIWFGDEALIIAVTDAITTYPQCAVTGEVTRSGPILYNIDATVTDSIQGLQGVTYRITYPDGVTTKDVVTGSDMANAISGLADGEYTIEQVDVPNGYLVVSQKKTFTISGGTGNVGFFYVYGPQNYGADKTAQVIDYVNRTYQVDLSASSRQTTMKVDPSNFIMVVDQSNSMLFPATLTTTNVEVTLYNSGSNWGTTNSQLITNAMNSAGLDKSQLYYIIADNANTENATSTVYALYYDPGTQHWLYQDASYYSKAYRYRHGDTKNVQENGSYVNYVNSGDSYQTATHGGDVNNALGDKLGSDTTSGSKSYTIYTGSTYNRLHELQQAICDMACLLNSLSPESTMTLELFCKDVTGCQSFTMNDTGMNAAIAYANDITTCGGTRQDRAIDHVTGSYFHGSESKVIYGTYDHTAAQSHLTDRDDYVILITDGAPNGVDFNTVNSSATALKNAMNSSAGTDKLATIGLSVTNVTSSMLYNAASDPKETWNKSVTKSGELTTYLQNLLLNHLQKSGTTAQDTTASIIDVVSDSFYIINPDTNQPLTDGTKIALDGHVDANGPGTVHYDSAKNEWYVEWKDQTFSGSNEDSSEGETWHGIVYIKAKEDFIGGNDIDTNKDATVTIQGSSDSDDTAFHLETPTVNVRLLPIGGLESEETRFLGDSVDEIQEKLNYLLEQTVIQKIKPYYGTDNVLNYKDVTADTAGLNSDSFILPYAIGRDLTSDEWTTLINGGTVTIEYTYDDASSHGAVGCFSFSLTKSGETADYEGHETTKTGEDIETYTLTVTYTAYKLGENGRDTENVHNGDNGPGTEVGSSGATTLENGLGTESVNDIHHVYVIDGEIILTKEIDATLTPGDTYTFELYESKNPDTLVDSKSITITEGNTSEPIIFGPLARGTYTVKETAPDGAIYMVREVSVEPDDTVCDYTAEKPTLVFEIGTNTNSSADDDDVIIDTTIKITDDEEIPDYQQSVWVNEERYIYSKPFTKPSSDDSGDDPDEGPDEDPETRWVYDWTSGTIVSTDTSGTQYVKLDQTTDELDAAHTGYGVLTQDTDNPDSWTVQWITWTSHQEGGGGGTETYEPVTLTYYQSRVDDFSAYTNGDYYYNAGTEVEPDYKQISSITDSWQLTIIAGGKTYYNVGPSTSQWDGTLNDNVLTYSSIYHKVSSGGSDPVTVWEKTTGESIVAENSKIPRHTETTTEPESPTVETGSRNKLSYGHGKITNTEAKYDASVPVQKRWDDGGSHSGDTVYVVLYQNDTPVTDDDGNARMIALSANNSWSGSFTVPAASRTYDPLTDGYEVREVCVMQEQQNEEGSLLPALVVGDTTKTWYVATAAENQMITIGDKQYDVRYTTDTEAKALVVTNYTAYSLPKTGGSGTRMFTIAGFALMAAAFVIGFGTRRKRERRTDY